MKMIINALIFISITYIQVSCEEDFVIFDEEASRSIPSQQYRQGTTFNSSYSIELLNSNKDKLKNITHHIFFDQLGSGVLPRENLTDFISQQYFIHNELLSLWASMLTDLRTLQEKTKGIDYLVILSEKYTKYYTDSIQTLQLDIKKIEKSEETKFFIQHIQSLTSSNYKIGEKLAILYSYCLSIQEATKRLKHDLIYNQSSYWINREWIEHHSNVQFNEVIHYLKDTIDFIYKKLRQDTILSTKILFTNTLIYLEKLLGSFLANSI